MAACTSNEVSNFDEQLDTASDNSVSSSDEEINNRPVQKKDKQRYKVVCVRITGNV